jgi:hypothetical protein
MFISDPLRLLGVTIWRIAFLGVPPLFYFLPTLRGMFRPGVDLRRVALINLFLGWTVIGWLIAIVIVDGPTRPSCPDTRPFG